MVTNPSLKAAASCKGHPGSKRSISMDFKARVGENFCAYADICLEII